ncbi:unnamed protein product [Aphis gossypii]|uniref:Uncharacterized protein n=1 Tax=Aphis gossypii TaxID=80765 RepID=A0A9P0NTP6_APHGO|nr:unnamed protein product [Aphis gossypii]
MVLRSSSKLYKIVFVTIPLSEPLLAFLRCRRVLQSNIIMISDLKLYYFVLVRQETVCPYHPTKVQWIVLNFFFFVIFFFNACGIQSSAISPSPARTRGCPPPTHTPSPGLLRRRRRPIVLSGARAACPLPARVIFYLF